MENPPTNQEGDMVEENAPDIDPQPEQESEPKTPPNEKHRDSMKLGERITKREHRTIPRFYRTNIPKCQKYTTYAGGSQFICPKQSQNIPNDSLNTEFLYYMGAIKELLPAMSVYSDRIKVLPWLKKLFAPEYQTSRLRLKRNKYLFHLVLVMISDTLFGIFHDPPPIGRLLEINQIQHPQNLPLARWEKDMYWEELLKGLRQEDSEMKCSCHEFCGENEEDGGNVHHLLGSLLDQEFKYFLYLARPLVSLIPEVKERSICAVWILTLAKVKTCSCLTMKAIRNDYIQALLGYLQELRVIRPFHKMPPDNGTTLKPLAEVVENKNLPTTSLNKGVTNPCSNEAEDFMQQQPIPDSGAFCYIAVTSNTNEFNKTSTMTLSPKKFEKYLGH